METPPTPEQPDTVPPTDEGIPPPEPTRVPKGMDYIPMPPLIRLFMVGVSAVLVFALIRLPGTVKIPVEYELGSRAMARREFPAAIKHLEPVTAAYPGYNDAGILLANAYFEDGQLAESAKIVESFNGKEVSPGQSQELDALASQLEWAAQQLESAEKKQGGTSK